MKPGGKYLVEVVVRTLNIGHLFSQGTVDSNEIWVELTAKSGGRVIGHSGGIDPAGYVDPYAHFINVYMLDRKGKRIDRRNPQDIFVPLYNKQIPPAPARSSTSGSRSPRARRGRSSSRRRSTIASSIGPTWTTSSARARVPSCRLSSWRRTRCRSAVAGGAPAKNEPSPIQPAWQRSNDYGIGLLLEGPAKGGQKGELRQAEEVFRKVAELGRADGWVNLARVYQKEGRIPEALAAP